jgi:hypothetical protein
VNSDTGSRIQQNPAISLDSANVAYAVWQDERNGAGKPQPQAERRRRRWRRRGAAQHLSSHR